MRAIRQSDIEIAKAEVSILRSLGMEPDPEALLLSQLESPPVQEVVVPGPVVEINGQAVEVEPVTADEGLVSGSLAHATRTGVAGDDDIDISLVLPATEDTTMLHLRMVNLHGGAQDVIGTMELSQLDQGFVSIMGESSGKHAKTDTSSPYVLTPLSQASAPASAQSDAGGGGDAVTAPAKRTPEELVYRAAASTAPSRMYYRVGRGEGSVALDAAQKQSASRQEEASKEGETGSAPVQIAAMTQRIMELNEHMKEHKHDYHTQRLLLALVARRRRMLSHLKKADMARYRALIDRLGLRR